MGPVSGVLGRILGDSPICEQKVPMKICPIAIAVGCAKCPVFKVCPLTSVIGDQPAKSDQSDKPVARSAATAPAKAARTAKATRPAAAAKTSRGAKSAASRKKSR
jgi:hypothetical protein